CCQKVMCFSGWWRHHGSALNTQPRIERRKDRDAHRCASWPSCAIEPRRGVLVQTPEGWPVYRNQGRTYSLVVFSNVARQHADLSGCCFATLLKTRDIGLPCRPIN